MYGVTRMLRPRRLLLVIGCVFILSQLHLLLNTASKHQAPANPEPEVINGIPQGVWIQRTVPPSASPAQDEPKPNIIIDTGIPKERIRERVFRHNFPEENMENRDKDLPAIERLVQPERQEVRSNHNIDLRICEGYEQLNTPPILTLFTSFSSESNRSVCLQNMLKNRALLSPLVRSIYYYVPKLDGVELFQRLAISCGVHVYPAPEVHPASNLPVLKTMWLHAEKVSKTEFYAYANADILFTEDLVQTLHYLQGKKKYLEDVNYLIVGQRVDYQFDVPRSIFSLEEVSELTAQGKRSNFDTEDYFITAKGHYPWKDIPKFVIGNVLYDNWLVMHAFTNRMVVFDVTETVTALHQSETLSRNRYHDDGINLHMAGNTTQLVLGMIKCAHFETHFRPTNDEPMPFLVGKKGKHSPCWHNFQKFNVDKDMFQTLIPGVA